MRVAAGAVFDNPSPAKLARFLAVELAEPANLGRLRRPALTMVRSAPEERFELYDLRVTVDRIEGRSVCGLEVGDYFELFPLTDIQQAYLVGRSGAFELGRVATHVYFEVRFESLDLARASSALERVVDRHEMLRAVFVDDGRQRILERVPRYEIAAVDLRGAPAQAVAEHFEATRERLSHEVRPADSWPLFAFEASRLDDGDVLHVSLDMLVLDMWSIRIVLADDYVCDFQMFPIPKPKDGLPVRLERL